MQLLAPRGNHSAVREFEAASRGNALTSEGKEETMRKHLMTVGALAFALSAASAFAQQAPYEEPQQPPAASEQAPMDEQTAPMGDLTGLEVYSSDGQKLGTVAKAEANAEGKVESIQIDIGGFLGIGQKTVEISADQFTQAGDRVELTLTADEVAELPEVKAE